MLANGNISAQYGMLRGGFAGTDQTVELMKKMSQGKFGSRSPKIRALAINIINEAGVPEKDETKEMVAIHKWVRDTIRYQKDVHGQETLSHPEETAFNSLAGDCLDGDTRLLTPTGYVSIKDIQIGDTIQGKNGWTTVINWWDKGTLSTRNYYLDNGGSFISTDDHKCFLMGGKEVRAGDLNVSDALLGPACFKLERSSDLTNDDALFIGIYLADGWEDQNSLCISGKDGFAKEAQKDWVRDYADGKGWYTSWHSKYIRVYIPKNDPMWEILSGGDIASGKKIPDIVFGKLNSENSKQLLEGLLSDSYHPMETKRSLDALETRKDIRRSGRCFSTTSSELALQVRLLYRLSGVSCRITKVDRHGGLGKNPVYRLYPRHFREKAAKISDITDTGSRHVYDIETQDHGIYLPDADVVVHNCDDKAMLEAALLSSIGIPTRFKTIGTTPFQFSHVYLEGRPRNSDWVPLDPIMKNKPAGWEVPKSRQKLVKVYSENRPTGDDAMNGMGHVGQPDGSSFLGPTRKAASPYVRMSSFLDSDLPIEQLSQQLPANPQNQNIPQKFPRQRMQAARRDPILYRPAGRTVGRLPVASVDALEAEVMRPGSGVDGVIGPDSLAGLGTLSAVEGVFGVGTENGQQGSTIVSIPKQTSAGAYMQSKTVSHTPEGVDSLFTRGQLIADPKKGDVIDYFGHNDMSERPPIYAESGISGDNAGAPLPGMGYIGVGAVGPGLAESDSAVPVSSQTPAPVQSNALKLVGFGLLALGVYKYATKKKRA